MSKKCHHCDGSRLIMTEAVLYALKMNERKHIHLEMFLVLDFVIQSLIALNSSFLIDSRGLLPEGYFQG